jgi:hypothetical protein
MDCPGHDRHHASETDGTQFVLGDHADPQDGMPGPQVTRMMIWLALMMDPGITTP